MSTLKAVRGTRDLLPPETELWNHIEATARRVFARYNFGEIRTPDLRRHVAVCARRGRRDGYCLQGDVHVGGSRAGAVGEGAVADAAAGEYGRRGARVHRAQAGRDGAAAEALLHRAAVPARASAEGALPAVLADWRGGDRAAECRVGVSVARCGSAGDAGDASR